MQPDTQAWDLGAAWSGESRGVPQGRGARATWKQRGGGRPPPCIWPRERLSSQAGRQGLPTGARASGIVEKTPPHNLQPPQPPPPRPLQVLRCPAALGTTEGHMPTSEAHRSVCCGDQARPADGRTWLPSAAGSRERVGGLRRGRPDGLWGDLGRNASQTGLCWGSTEIRATSSWLQAGRWGAGGCSAPSRWRARAWTSEHQEPGPQGARGAKGRAPVNPVCLAVFCFDPWEA